MSQPAAAPRFIRLDLTTEQQAEVLRATGRPSQAIELTAEELEERVVPRLGGNRNETLAVESLEERIVPGIRLQNHNESLVVEDLEDRVTPRAALNHNETML